MKLWDALKLRRHFSCSDRVPAVEPAAVGTPPL